MTPPASSSGALVAGIVAMKRRRIVRAFRNHGATSPETAMPLSEVGLSNKPLVRAMKRRRVIVDAGGDRFYLDNAREREVARTRRAFLVAVLVVVVVALLVFWRMGMI